MVRCQVNRRLLAGDSSRVSPRGLFYSPESLRMNNVGVFEAASITGFV